MGTTPSVEERVDTARDKVADRINDMKTGQRQLQNEEKKLTNELVKIQRDKKLQIVAKAKLIAANQIMQTTIEKNLLGLQTMDQKLTHLNLHNTTVESMNEVNAVLNEINESVDAKSVKKLANQFQRNINTMESNQENISNTLTQDLDGLEQNTDEIVKKILDMHHIDIDLNSPQVPNQVQQQQPVVSLLDLPSAEQSLQARLEQVKQ